jgi:hypothetical protein
MLCCADRWLSLAEQLQLPGVADCILRFLQGGLRELGGQPEATAAVLAYAQQHLSKEQLLQLLQISMQAASSCQQQQQQSGFVQPAQQMFMPPGQQQTLSAAFDGWLGQGPGSSSSQGFNQQQIQQQQRLGWQQPVPLFNPSPPIHHQQLAASTSCSGTSSDPAGRGSAHCSDEASSDNAEAAADSQQQQHALDTEQQRLKLCMSSGLFAPAALPQQQQQQQQQQQARPSCLAPAASPAASFAAPVPAVQGRSVAAACPVPRFPVMQAGGFTGFAGQHPQQQQQAFGAQSESFGFGVNGGTASIADWMRSQPEGMCLS